MTHMIRNPSKASPPMAMGGPKRARRFPQTLAACLLVLLLILTGSARAGPPETTNDADAWLTRIQKRADQLKTLTASVRYDRNQGLLGDKQRRFGKLVYAAKTDDHPARFSIHFDRLVLGKELRRIDQWFIFDGHWLLDRDAAEKTATRRELVDPDADTDDHAGNLMQLGDGPFALPLDMDPAAVKQRFKVKLAPGIAPGTAGENNAPANTIHLVLTPRPELADTLDQQRIDLWYDRDSLLPVRAATTERDQSSTTIDLLKTQVNPKLGDASFNTTLPTGSGWQTQTIKRKPAPQN